MYLEKGHTFMAADSIHGNIGKLFRKTSTIPTFNDFVELCEKANSNIKTVILDLPHVCLSHFEESALAIVEKEAMPLLENIVEVQFNKGTNLMLYKKSFDEPGYTTVDFLQPYSKRMVVSCADK